MSALEAPPLTDQLDAMLRAPISSSVPGGYHDLTVVVADTRLSGISLRWEVTSHLYSGCIVDTGLLRPETIDRKPVPLFEQVVCALGLADLLEYASLDRIAQAMVGRSLRALVFQNEYLGQTRSKLVTVEALR